MGLEDKERTLCGTCRTLLARLCSLLAHPRGSAEPVQTALRQQAQQLLVRTRCEVHKVLWHVEEQLGSLWRYCALTRRYWGRAYVCRAVYVRQAKGLFSLSARASSSSVPHRDAVVFVLQSAFEVSGGCRHQPLPVAVPAAAQLAAVAA